MLRDIHLHGQLGARFGAVHQLDVQTAAEAVRALSMLLPGFAGAIRDGSWHVVRGASIEDGLDLDATEVVDFRLGAADLHLVPAVGGAKDGGAMLKTVLGVALVGAAFAFSGGTLAAPIMMGALNTGMVWGNVAMIGVGLALSGVSSFLSPEEKSKEDRDSSFTMQGPSSAHEEGMPVPLIYGEIITGGMPISGGIDVEKIAVGQ